MTDFAGKIKAIEEKLRNLDALLNTTEQEVNKLQNESQLDKAKIKSKEKELEEWRKKLEECQREKNKMEKELMVQIEELKKPELPEAEKQTKANYLFDKQKQDLERLEHYLYEERTHYRQVKDKLVNKLLQQWEFSQQSLAKVEKERNLAQKWNMVGGISGGILFTFLLVLLLRKRKRDNKFV